MSLSLFLLHFESILGYYFCLYLLLRFPRRARSQKAETWFWSKCSRTGRDANIWPAVWNGLPPETSYLQIHPHQPHLQRVPVGMAATKLQEQRGTRECAERGGRHSARGEQSIAKDWCYKCYVWMDLEDREGRWWEDQRRESERNWHEAGFGSVWKKMHRATSSLPPSLCFLWCVFFFLILHYATLSMQLAACKKDVIREFRLCVCVCVYVCAYVCVCMCAWNMQEENNSEKINAVQSVLLVLQLFTKQVYPPKGNVDFIGQIGSCASLLLGPPLNKSFRL